MARVAHGTKAVAAAGTRERLVAAASNVQVRSVTIVAKEGNTGVVYIGGEAIAANNSPDLNPGDAVSFASGDAFNLADVWVDAAVSGEGVDYWGME